MSQTKNFPFDLDINKKENLEAIRAFLAFSAGLLGDKPADTYGIGRSMWVVRVAMQYITDPKTLARAEVRDFDELSKALHDTDRNQVAYAVNACNDFLNASQKEQLQSVFRINPSSRSSGKYSDSDGIKFVQLLSPLERARGATLADPLVDFGKLGIIVGELNQHQELKKALGPKFVKEINAAYNGKSLFSGLLSCFWPSQRNVEKDKTPRRSGSKEGSLVTSGYTTPTNSPVALGGKMAAWNPEFLQPSPSLRLSSKDGERKNLETNQNVGGANGEKKNWVTKPVHYVTHAKRIIEKENGVGSHSSVEAVIGEGNVSSRVSTVSY